MIQGYNPEQDNQETITNLGFALQEDLRSEKEKAEEKIGNSVEDMAYEKYRDEN